MKSCTRLPWTFFVVAASLFLMSSGPLVMAAEESKLDEVMKRGYVIAAVTDSSPPYGFLDDKKNLVGFDIDIAKLIAKGLFDDEKKIKLEPISYDARWAYIQTGKADFGIMTTTIYPNRIMRVDFTRPYDYYSMTILVRKDAGINNLDDLNNPKYTIANLNNPQQMDRVKKYIPQVKILTVESASQQYLAVSTGRAHALQHNSMLCGYYAKQNPNLKVLNEDLGDWEAHGVFLRKGDFKWWNTLDQLVGEIISGAYYNDYKAIMQKWFGIEPPQQYWWIGKGYFQPK